MNELTNSVTTIAVAIVGIALLAVLVSQRSNTAGVLTAGGNAFANALSAATGPVTGSSTAANVGNQGMAGFGALTGGFQLPSF